MCLHSTKSLENIDLSDCSPSDTTIEDKMEGVRGALIELPAFERRNIHSHDEKTQPAEVVDILAL